jgi:hypothetical protein
LVRVFFVAGISITFLFAFILRRRGAGLLLAFSALLPAPALLPGGRLVSRRSALLRSIR